MREPRLSGDVLNSNPVIPVHIQYNTLVAHVTLTAHASSASTCQSHTEGQGPPVNYKGAALCYDSSVYVSRHLIGHAYSLMPVRYGVGNLFEIHRQTLRGCKDK